MDITPEEQDLLEKLRSIQKKLRQATYAKYKRINPFCEDLFDWKERGKFWTNKDNVTVYNSATLSGNVQIGDNTWIGPYVTLDGGGGLTIGHHCSIALGCQLLTHDTVKWALSGGNEPYEYQPISVGDCCFLGSNSIICKGVTIGDHCLIASGAVVTNNVESYSIVAGIPARIVGYVEITEGLRVKLRFNNDTKL